MTEQQFRDKHKGKCSYVNREKELDELISDAYLLASANNKANICEKCETENRHCGSKLCYGCLIEEEAEQPIK